jgi:hypothetical protein
LIAETGLSRDEQRTAKALQKHGLLEERYDRLGHQLYFRVNVDAYNALIERMHDAIDGGEDQRKPLKVNQIRKAYMGHMEIVYRHVRKPYIASSEIPDPTPEKKPGRSRWHKPKTPLCGYDGCDTPQCRHTQFCASHACCEVCTGGPVR